MFTTLSFTLLVAFFQSTLAQELSGATVVQSSVIFRHGESTPDSRSTYAPEALFPTLNMLTDRGRMQTVALGQWYRQLVQSLLADDTENIWAESTRRARSAESAEAFIRGVVGGNGDHVRRHSTALGLDEIFNFATCNKSDQLQKRALQSNETMQFLREHQDVFTFLRQHNVPEELLRVENFWKISDGLRTRQEHDMALPEELREGDMSAKIEEVTQFLWNQQYIKEDEVIRLSVGVLMKEIADQIEKVTNPQMFARTPSKPIFMLAGHHNTMMHALALLGLYDGSYVELSSALVIELVRDDSSGQFFVRVLYKRGRDYPRAQVKILPLCENDDTVYGCPVGVFLTNMRPNLLTSEERTRACRAI